MTVTVPEPPPAGDQLATAPVELAKGDAYGDAKFKGTEEQPPFMLVEGKIRRSRPNMLEHFKFLKANVKKGTPKFTMPSALP